MQWSGQPPSKDLLGFKCQEFWGRKGVDVWTQQTQMYGQLPCKVVHGLPPPPLWPLRLLGHSGLCTGWPLLTPWYDLLPPWIQSCSSERSWRHILSKVTVPFHQSYFPLFCSMVFLTAKHCTACLCVCILSVSLIRIQAPWRWGFRLGYSFVPVSTIELAFTEGVFTETRLSVFLCVKTHLYQPFLGLWKGKRLRELSAEKKSPAICVFTKLQWSLQMHNDLFPFCLQNVWNHVKKQARAGYWAFLWNGKHARMGTGNLQRL